MDHSVSSGVTYVQGGGCCYNGGNPPTYFRSVWDRLCQQLFGAIPPGTDSENILPDVEIWTNGVALVEEDNGSYSFAVTSAGDVAPKPYDIVLYKGKYYIIGAVE